MQVIRSKLVALLLAHLRARGADASAIADRLGIPEVCRDPSRFGVDVPAIPVTTLVSVAEEGARELGDPWLGLRLAQALPRGVYGVLEYAIRNAPVLGEAALRLVRYQQLTNDAMTWGVERDSASSSLTMRAPGFPEGLGRQLGEFWPAIAYRYIVELAGEPLVPREVRFPHATRPPELGPLIEHFGTDRFTFGSGTGALIFSPDTWSRRVVSADPALLPVVESYARALMPAEDLSSGWVARVRDYLRRNLSGGALAIDKAAEALGTPPRSLQRRLEDAGTSFREVLDRLREEEARRLVGTSDTPIDEVSFLLGYAERRAFLRAFRRWTGAAPAAFRREAHALA